MNRKRRRFFQVCCGLLLSMLSSVLLSSCGNNDASHSPDASEIDAILESKPPSPNTLAVLQKAKTQLPIGDFADGTLFSDHSDETLLARFPDSIFPMSEEEQAFYLADNELPAVHPSLLRAIRTLVKGQGLYQLAEGVYQIRGDLAHVTIVRGESGWIFLDVGRTPQFVGPAWEFAKTIIPGGETLPVKAIVISHSHSDHFGGIKGVVDEDDVTSGAVQIIAPYGFTNEVISESVMLGPAMYRRAQYHFGGLLTTKADGSERVYLPVMAASSSFMRPSLELPEGAGEMTRMSVDGIEFEFMDISGGEAPASTLIYVPKYEMLFNSELFIFGLHNLYTLRGAKTRDALRWSKYINQALVVFGDRVDLMTGPHGPTFNGKDRAIEYLKAQRDNYGLIHNQAVRLANSGVKIGDVGDAVEQLVPASLSQLWHTRGYHGTYSHNARAVVNYYLGFYDGNPANLNPLTSEQEAEKFVEYMGGADAILERAGKDYEKGQYRFVATALDKLVTAQPNNQAASSLLADCFEQLGFQAEGPQWRNAYLAATKELRQQKVLSRPPSVRSIAAIAQHATIENVLDLLAVSIDASKAEGISVRLNIKLEDIDEIYLLELLHSNLSSIQTDKLHSANATLVTTRKTLVGLLMGAISLDDALTNDDLTIEGEPLAFAQIMNARAKPPAPFELVSIGGN